MTKAEPNSTAKTIKIMTNEMLNDLKKNATFDINCRHCKDFKIFHINHYCTLQEIAATMKNHMKKVHGVDIS